MAESKRFTLSRIDLSKIAMGALIAIAGALLTYTVETVGQIDFGDYTPIVVAVSGILVNAARKFLAEQQSGN